MYQGLPFDDVFTLVNRLMYMHELIAIGDLVIDVEILK